MLLSIRPIRGGAEADNELDVLDQRYRPRRCAYPSCWMGEATELLRLRGPVKRKHFANLLKGLDPKGKVRIVPDALVLDRIGAFDCRISAPGDVNTLWATAPRRERQNIEHAHQLSVMCAAVELQKRLSRSFEGKGFVIAAFQHRTNASRTPDLHTHLVLLNFRFRPDGTVQTFTLNEVEKLKNDVKQLYTSRLSGSVRVRFGLNLQPALPEPKIVGVPKELRTQLAQGESLQEQGSFDYESKKVRNRTLFRNWSAKARDAGWSKSAVKALFRFGVRLGSMRQKVTPEPSTFEPPPKQKPVAEPQKTKAAPHSR